MKKIKILVLSGGSLVAQNIFDSLEKRRKNIEIIVADSLCQTATVFRADKVYKSPQANSIEFENFFVKLLKKENPHLVLPGRDADVIALSSMVVKYPEWANIIATGNNDVASILCNKWNSYIFFKQYDLPFAHSIHSQSQDFEEDILKLSFPVIAKPLSGYGSHGVFYVLNMRQLNSIRKMDADYIFQELIDPSTGFSAYLEKIKKSRNNGIPLFSYLPDDKQIAIQCIIGPRAEVSELFVSVSKMIIGKCEKSELISIKQGKELGLKIARHFCQLGWKGCLNIQGRMKGEELYITELGGRVSGSTSARAIMGFDEIGILLNYFTGIEIPSVNRDLNKQGYVERVLTDYFVPYDGLRSLQEKGFWLNT